MSAWGPLADVFVLAWAVVRRRRVLMSCGDDLVELVEFVAPWATTAYADTEVAYVAGCAIRGDPVTERRLLGVRILLV